MFLCRPAGATARFVGKAEGARTKADDEDERSRTPIFLDPRSSCVDHTPRYPERTALMSEQELTVQVDDFLVMRRPPLTPEGKASTDKRDRINTDFLSRIAKPPAGGALSGAFICAHAPDYRGRPTLHYTEQDWQALFRELKEIGITTVILQAAAWVDFRECYYPSKLFSGFHTWNVLDPMVKASAAERMTLHLGAAGILYGHIELGAGAGDLQKAKAAAEREVKCHKELLERYRGAFQGYYLAPETGFHEGINPGHYRCYHEFFKRVTNGVKAITPELPILTSPYTTCCAGHEQEAVDCLTRLHDGCPITAFAPQDSIGTFNNLPFLEKGLTIWKEVCRQTGAEFWVNCESFCIEDFGGPICTIVPADFKRFAVQLDTATRLGAKKLVSWEPPFFMAKEGGEAARGLRHAYLASRRPAGP